MDIKCNFNPYYHSIPPRSEERTFCGRSSALMKSVGKSAELKTDIFVKRPVANKSATGLSGFWREYVNNIKHTYNHKLDYATMEKRLFGRNSIDSITHDLDKLILYMLGFPKSFVTKFHRAHSSHHVENNLKKNVRSMVCDNLVSSPQFKPEKTLSVRDHFNSNSELQNVQGLKEMLEALNFGEDLDFLDIKAAREAKYKGAKGIITASLRAAAVGLLAMPKFLLQIL